MEKFLEHSFASYFELLELSSKESALSSKAEPSDWKAKIITNSFSIIVLNLRQISSNKKEQLLCEIINLEVNQLTTHFCKAINNNFANGTLLNGNCYIKINSITFFANWKSSELQFNLYGDFDNAV